MNAYVYTIARNNAFNFIKHKTVEQSYLDNYRPYNNIDTPEELIFVKEISLLIEMTVSQMPAQRKRIYILSRNCGISNSDIATQLNISKKTVENQLSLALKELRNVITALYSLFFLI